MASCDSSPVDPSDPSEDAGYAYFKSEFEKLSGINLSFYKEKQMKRRIDTLIGRKLLKDYASFIAFLKSDPAELESFKNYITINVTDFFRTPDHWSHFEEEVIPNLLAQSDGKLKIWSSACSTGEEAYSLAMSLLRSADPSRFHIIATDINEEVLQAAKEGRYTEKSAENLSPEVLERFFIKDGSCLRVSDELKSCVEFRKLDLLRDKYPSDCDLIVCRNVLIYFTEEAKDSIYMRFKENLSHGGYLFTGNTEQIIYYKKFGLNKIGNYLYRNP